MAAETAAGGSPPCPLCGSTAVWHRCRGAELAAGSDADHDRRMELASEVAYLRDELDGVQERFGRVLEQVRTLPGGEAVYQHRRLPRHPARPGHGRRLGRRRMAGRGGDVPGG